MIPPRLTGIGFRNIRELLKTPIRLRDRLANAIPTRVRRRGLTIRASLVLAGGAKGRAVFDVLRLPYANPACSTVRVYRSGAPFFCPGKLGLNGSNSSI